MKKLRRPHILERTELEMRDEAVLVEIILQQQEMISQLFDEIERLKELGRIDSSTSSKPPSSDLIKRSESPPSDSSPKERKAGGQVGHDGKTRKGFGRIDRYEILHPNHCPTCGGTEFAVAQSTYRHHQVAQWRSPIEIVDYAQATCACCRCGSRVVAPLPEDVIEGQDLSASLQAHLVWLGTYGHLSYQKQQEWLREVGQIDVGLGTLCATTGRVAKAVTTQVQALTDWVKQGSAIQVDESPWLVKGIKEWIWTFTGVGFCLFHAGETRSRRELETILGQSFAGVLSSDDFSVYNGYPVGGRQKCLAHLLRHFNRVSKLKLPQQQELAAAFMALIREAFGAHREWRESQNRTAYDEWVSGFKLRVSSALKTWGSKAGYAAGLLLRNLRDHADQWWYFLDHPEIPPDNNRSERALRLAVTKRKVSGGSRSMTGFEQTATLLTVVQTCRAQGRSALHFLTQAITQNLPATALIPTPPTPPT